MDQAQLRGLATEFLLPLISRTTLLSDPAVSTDREERVAFIDPCTIEFKADRADTYRLAIRRSQPFEKLGTKTVSEIDVVEAFVHVVNAMKNGLQSWYRADLSAMFPRRVVVRSLCGTKAEEEALLAVLDQMTSWSGRQYEGKPIPASVGFVPGDTPGVISFGEFCTHDFGLVLSNGLDTLVTCNLKGEVLGHEALPEPDHAPKFAPYRLAGAAHWARDGRIVMALNRSGEILIFKNGALVFTRRAGRWHFLTHRPVVTQMRRPDSRVVRQAVYESCLDASFARTGACVGIVIAAKMADWPQVATCSDDYLASPTSPKAKAIARMVGGKRFQDLDRRFRQELLAIDGATLIDHYGTLLAAGAILQIPGGSAGGGRLAAAKALSKFGLGIKISQDGGIRAYQDEELRFAVM